MLASGQLSEPERQEAVTVIARNTKAEAQVIDDLLDVSRMIMGKVDIPFTQLPQHHVVTPPAKLIGSGRPASRKSQERY